MRFLLLPAALLATALPAQMTALVNDPNSHGAVGDNLLSLEEVIRFMNLQLRWNNLSAAEQAQFSGAPTSVLDTCHIDATITPVITVTQQLSDLFGDSITHVDNRYFSLNGRVVIDATGVSGTVLHHKTNHSHWHDFVFRGGDVFHVYDTTLHYHPGVRARFVNCDFENHAQVGLDVRVPVFPPGQILEMDLTNCVFDNCGTAIKFTDPGFSSLIDFTSTKLLIQNCSTGVDLDITSFGATNMAIFDRTVMTGVTTGVHAARPTGSGSVFDLQFVHGSITASGSAIDIEGAVIGAQALALHHMDVTSGAGAGDHALQSRPASSRLDLTVGECSFDGKVNLGIGSLSQGLRVHNSRFTNGAFTLESSGPNGDFRWNVHESSPVTVGAGNSKPVNFAGCEFVSSAVQNSGSGSTSLFGCYFSGSPITNASNVAPAPLRWIGQASVTPDNPALGGTVDLAVNLQPNTAAAWLLGISERTPITSLVPYRFYMNLIVTIGLPGPYVLQDTVQLTIPNSAAIQGIELYAQPIVYPLAGQTYVPLHMPRGGKFEIQ